MYAASQDYWDAVWNPSRALSMRVVITGTDPNASPLTITQSQIKSVDLDDHLMSDDTFEIGNATMRTINFSFFDESNIASSIGIGGAPVDVYLGIDGEEVFYGRFFVNEAYHNNMTTSIEAVDAMGYASVGYESTASFPISVYNLLLDVCSVAGLTLQNATIPHGNIMIPMEPEEEVTCRQMLMYIADIAGGSFKIERDNSDNVVKFITLSNTGKTIPVESTFSEEVADNPIVVTGAKYGEYLQGDDTFTIKIEENPLMSQFNDSDIYNILSDIITTYSETSFYPCKSSVSSNAAFESGDVVYLTKKDGSTFPVLLTHISQSGLSQMQVVGAGETIQKNNYVTRGRLSSKVSAIDNALKEQSGFIRIDKTVPSITLGREDADASVVITNESVTINGSDGATATLESSKLSADQISTKNSYVGNWMWISRTVNGVADQNLSLKWVGG